MEKKQKKDEQEVEEQEEGHREQGSLRATIALQILNILLTMLPATVRHNKRNLRLNAAVCFSNNTLMNRLAPFKSLSPPFSPCVLHFDTTSDLCRSVAVQ